MILIGTVVMKNLFAYKEYCEKRKLCHRDRFWGYKY